MILILSSTLVAMGLGTDAQISQEQAAWPSQWAMDSVVLSMDEGVKAERYESREDDDLIVQSNLQASFFDDTEVVDFGVFAEQNQAEIFAAAAVVNAPADRQDALCNLAALQSLNPEQQIIFAEALAKVDCEQMQSLTKVVFYDDPNLPRAMAGQTSLHLNAGWEELPEIQGLLIHEFGHIIDLGGMRGSASAQPSSFTDGAQTIWINDPSVDFYTISWTDNDTQREGSQQLDFVTGYAATDPFEDFAESFTLYVENGSYFREMTTVNQKLAAKYAYLRYVVFDGVEFGVGSDATYDAEVRYWDGTRL